MANFANLDAALAALIAQVATTQGTEASAAAVIRDFSVKIDTAVREALTLDNSADDASIAAASAAIAEVTGQFMASAAELGDAIAAYNPEPPPPPAEFTKSKK